MREILSCQSSLNDNLVNKPTRYRKLNKNKHLITREYNKLVKTAALIVAKYLYNYK